MSPGSPFVEAFIATAFITGLLMVLLSSDDTKSTTGGRTELIGFLMMAACLPLCVVYLFTRIQ